MTFLPLARFRRDQGEVVLHDPFRPPFLLRFRTAEEVVDFLRTSVRDPGDIEALRQGLHGWAGVSVRPLSDDEVLTAVANHVIRGELALSAWSSGSDLPALLRPPVKPAMKLGGLPAVPKLVTPPLLPRLELVQISGAGVLLEIKQTLQAVKAALGQIGTANVSIEPAPSGIPPVQASLKQTGSQISSTLGSL
jgi:hypothetical protein